MTPPSAAWGAPSLVRMLGLTYALLVALIVTTGGAGFMALWASLSATDRILQDVQPARESNAAVLIALTEVQSGVRGYLLTGNPEFLDGARRGRAAFRREAPVLTSRGADVDLAPAVRRQVDAASSWLTTYPDPVLEQSKDPGGLQDLRRTWDNKAARTAFETFRLANARLEERLLSESQRLQDGNRAVRRGALGVLVLVVVASASVAVAASARTSRGAVGPLARLRQRVESMSDGQAGERVEDNAGPEEVRAVARAINVMADEGELLRAAEQDQLRARRTAHDVGLRIRERIDVEAVVTVALEEIGTAFGADLVLLRRLDGGDLGGVCAQWHEVDEQPLDASTCTDLAALGSAAEASRMWDDVSVATWTDGLDPAPEDPLSAVQGVALACDGRAALTAAFGAGREALGTVTLVQRRQARVWSVGDVSAIEAIAADLGRALQHAALYERERALVEQLRELDRTKTDFLSTVSHELRTPLTSITGYIELLRDSVGTLQPGQVRMLDVIERNSYRLSALIEDLLTLSRIESGAAQTHHVPVDVASLVHNACADVRPGARDAGLDLEVVPGPEGARVSGDPGLLDRVLLNLLSNAVKFTPRGGHVVVTWEVVDADVQVSVRDTGIGIPDDETHRLSSRFFRASNAMAAAIPGTGLGLSIVRGVLDNHDGRLEIEPGRPGTRVVVVLPQLPAPDRTGTPVASARL